MMMYIWKGGYVHISEILQAHYFYALNLYLKSNNQESVS